MVHQALPVLKTVSLVSLVLTVSPAEKVFIEIHGTIILINRVKSITKTAWYCTKSKTN